MPNVFPTGFHRGSVEMRPIEFTNQGTNILALNATRTRCPGSPKYRFKASPVPLSSRSRAAGATAQAIRRPTHECDTA